MGCLDCLPAALRLDYPAFLNSYWAPMKFAAIFPGQGSQSIKMLSELSASYSSVKHTFDEASEVLSLDLWKLTQEGPESDLNSTENTQPAMLAAGIAVWRVWNEQGGCAPLALAGHSLGEYSALVASNALVFSTAVTLVAERGRQMQAAVPEGKGGMAAILGLDDEAVIELCEAQANGQVLSAVNFNSPGQVVIAGEAEAVDRAVDAAREAGAKRAIKLPVSVPSHCELMRPAAENIAARLAEIDIQVPVAPVIHNVDAAVRTDAEGIRSALSSQLYQPVRWVDSVAELKSRGATQLIEFGPGKVLTGLARRIDRRLAALCVFDSESLDKALAGCEGDGI